MTSERWELVTRIFDAALDQPEGVRQDFVRQECSGQAEIEAEVLKLLAADAHAASFLERPAVTTLPSRSMLNHSDFAVGSVVCGRFEIVRFIGRGGMGQVYEALDLELKTRIALKAIRSDVSSDPRMLSRFRREVQLTRLITHPNVCRTFDIERHSSDLDGHRSDITFLTMELLPGETLAAFLQRQKQLTTAEALPLVLQMINALSAAHAVGIVHRDFKPSNVLLVSSSATPPELRVVVTDFGLARTLAPGDGQASAKVATSLTGSQGLMGTLVYMAPEQFERGEVSVASDIYSLGLVMYEMVTGQRPFADEMPFAEAAKRLKQPAPSAALAVPNIDFKWNYAIFRCLACDPKDRFKKADEIAEALTRANPTEIPRPSSSTRVPQAIRRRLLAAIAILTLLASFSVGLIRLTKWRSQNSLLTVGSNILVTEIENVSGDPDLSGTAELLRNELSQSGYMNLLEPSRVKEALERMSRPKDAVLEPKTAREVAWREGVPLVIFGTVSRVAEDYRLDLKAERIGSEPSPPKGSWKFSETASSKKDFIDVVRHGGHWVRQLVGETESDIGNADRSLDDVTTGNWEALKLYSDGQRLAFLDKDEEAALLFKRAAEKDPNFAMAWMRLGDTLDTLGRSAEGFEYWRKALAVSGDRRLTPREELRIKGMYASDTGDLKAAVEYFSQYSISYPTDRLGFFFRGVPLMLLGRTEEAIQVLHEAERRAPDSYYTADHLARYNLILVNFAEVSRYTARVRQLGHPGYADEVDGQASVLAGDYDRADRLFLGLDQAGDPFLHSVGFYLRGAALAEQGRYNEAIRILKAGAADDLPVGDAADRADKLMGIAYLYFKQGNREAARQASFESLEAEPGVRRTADIGGLLAQAGFVPDAQKLLKGLDANDPERVTKVARLRLSGEILLAQGHCQLALAAFEKAKREDQEDALLHDYWGRSLFKCGRTDEALREFERMQNRPGQVWHQPESYFPGWRADLLLEYARSAALLHPADARSAVTHYLELRSHADPGLPEPAEAEKMLKKLSKSSD